MISVYLVIAIVCAILLIIMAFMGGFGGDADIGGHDVDVGGHDVDMGHYDAGHGDYSGSYLSPMSIPIILVFGTTFGAIGAIFEGLDYNYMIIPLIAGIAGLAVAGTMYFMVSKYLISTQSSSHLVPNDYLGLTGMTSIPIRKGEPGQIVLNTEKRGRVPLSATAHEEIEDNVSVKVIAIAGNSVVVEKVKEG